MGEKEVISWMKNKGVVYDPRVMTAIENYIVEMGDYSVCCHPLASTYRCNNENITRPLVTDTKSWNQYATKLIDKADNIKILTNKL